MISKILNIFMLSIALTMNIAAQEPPVQKIDNSATSTLSYVKSIGTIAIGTATIAAAFNMHAMKYRHDETASLTEYMQEFLIPNSLPELPGHIVKKSMFLAPFIAGFYMAKKGIQDCIALYRVQNTSQKTALYAAGNNITNIAAGIAMIAHTMSLNAKMKGSEDTFITYLQKLFIPKSFSELPSLALAQCSLFAPLITGLYMIKKGAQHYITGNTQNISQTKPSLISGISKVILGSASTIGSLPLAIGLLSYLTTNKNMSCPYYLANTAACATSVVASGYVLKDGIQECYQAYKQKKHEK